MSLFSLKRYFFFLTCAFLLLPMPVFAEQEITVSPPIISDESKSPGILEYDLTLKNGSDSRRDIYVIVRDVVEGGEKKYDDPSELEMTEFLTRWVKIERGVIELGPGEALDIPLKLNIPSNVSPGFYHAAITFARGSNRPQAEKAADDKNEAKLIVNLEIKKHEVEKAQVVKFSSGGSILTGSPVDFTVEIENIGNKDIIPEGEIIIYDKSGKIVDSLNVAEPRKTVSSQKGKNKQKYQVSWEPEKKFGKFKAKLMMYYGQDQKDLNDILTFVLMPLPLLIILGLFIVSLVALFSYLLLRNNITNDITNDGYATPKGDMVEMPFEAKEVEDEPGAGVKPERRSGEYVIDLKSRR